MIKNNNKKKYGLSMSDPSKKERSKSKKSQTKGLSPRKLKEEEEL